MIWLLKLYLERSHAILDTDKKQVLSEATLANLENAVSKIEKGIAENLPIEVEAYARALPRMLGGAEKEIYQASK